MNKNIRLSPLELDYLKANGELMGFNAKNSRHRKIVMNYLVNAGFEEKKSGNDWVLFENKDMGMRAFFSNFPMNNKKASMRPTLSIDLSGHFFIRKNADVTARKLLLFFINKFGTFFKISRVDIRQDVYNAKHPFDYFPDFTKEENKLIWALRGNPEFQMYHNSSPTEKATGFTIKTSRYTIMSYNRNLSLEQKLKKGQITQGYYDYYKSLYKSNDVQRLEISLKQDACKIFALMFFNAEYDKDKLLRFVMANFARNHALKEYDATKPLHKMKVNETFSQLFFYEEKEELKYFRAKLERKAGLTLSEVTFSDRGRSLEEIAKMLGRKLCELSDGCSSKLSELRKVAEDLLNNYQEEFKTVMNDRRDRFEKALSFMDISAQDMIESRSQLYQFAT